MPKIHQQPSALGPAILRTHKFSPVPDTRWPPPRSPCPTPAWKEGLQHLQDWEFFSYKSVWASPKRAVYIIKFRRNYNWIEAKASLFSSLPREQGFGEKIKIKLDQRKEGAVLGVYTSCTVNKICTPPKHTHNSPQLLNASYYILMSGLSN